MCPRLIPEKPTSKRLNILCLKCDKNEKVKGKSWCKQCDLILTAKARVNAFNDTHDL